MITIKDDLGQKITIDPLQCNTIKYIPVPDGGVFIKELPEELINCTQDDCDEYASYMIVGMYYNRPADDVVCFNCEEHKQIILENASKGMALYRHN